MSRGELVGILIMILGGFIMVLGVALSLLFRGMV